MSTRGPGRDHDLDVVDPTTTPRTIAGLRIVVAAIAERYDITITVGALPLTGVLPVDDALTDLTRGLLLNAARHSHCTHAWAAAEITVDSVVLTVTDNGIGHAHAHLHGTGDSGHFGLVALRDVVNRLDGSFAINATPGRGTRVSASLPLPAVQTGLAW